MRRTPIFTFVLGIIVTAGAYEATDLRLLGKHPQTSATAAAPPPMTAAKTAAELSRAVAPGLRARQQLPAGGAISEDEAAALRARTALAESRVEASEGRESPWPTNVDPQYRREEVEKQLKRFVVDRGLAKVDHMDCSEFPCVSVLTLSENGPQAREQLHAALKEMIKANYGGHVALSISASQAGTGSDATSVAGVSVMPDDEDVKTRTRYRTSQEMADGGH